ncbi:MAG: hypothetical protein CMJ34_06235 [Phycisphaerae bacterium]|nr:hypothetical protein [Phycisphaerae bacterium]
MSRRHLLPAIVVATVSIATLLGWASGSGRLGEGREDLERRIATYVNVLTTVREERLSRPALDERIKAVVDGTLGTDLEYVDAELRRRIAALCEGAGLRDVTISTLGAGLVGTPARREFKRVASERAYRDEPDFARVGATAGGVGSLADAVRFLHDLDVAPWVKRIESVRLDPIKDGRLIRISIRVSTIFVPGLPPDPENAPATDRRRGLERYAVLIDRNPFVVPEPPKARPAAKPRPKPAPRKDPLTQWMLTGLVEGGPGVEAWCRHLGDGRSATLLPGVVTDLPGGGTVVLVEIDGDVATIRSGEETWRVLVGSTLDRRLP